MRIVIASILVRAAQIYGVGVQDITEHRRNRNLIEARMAIAVSCRHFNFSYPEIGKALKRDHSTIIHNYHRGVELCGSQIGFADVVEELMDAAIPGCTEFVDLPRAA